MQKFFYHLLAGLILWSCQELPLIRAPFNGVENKIHQLNFDADLGGTLALQNGSKIVIPPNAFVTADGALAKGEVTFSYTEMQDVASILISGIPLNIGEGKNMEVMESAVMFDLSANQNGKQLKLANGKTLKTSISSNQGDPSYNLYRLDQGKKSWDYLENIAPTPNPDLFAANQLIEEAGLKIDEMDLSKCVAFNYLEFIDVPKKPKDKLFNYYEYDEYPNLNTLKRLLSEKIKGYGARFVDGSNWEFIKIEGKSYPIPMVLWELEKPIPEGAYQVRNVSMKSKRLKNGRYLFELQRYDFGKRNAQGYYESGKWVKLYDFIAKPVMPLAALYANPMKAWTASYDSLLQEVESQKAIAAMQNEVVRSFEISDLGIYNYDVIKDEERVIVSAQPVMDGKSISEGADFFAILKGRNSVIRYRPQSLKRFVLYPGQEIYLFKLTDGNKVLQMKGNPLAGLDLTALGQQENPTLTIDFEMSDFEISSPEDVAAFIAKVTGGKSPAVISMK
ncbi:MAG: hypothetical protein AAFQ94_27235 [Bacteroidota bacterium]